VYLRIRAATGAWVGTEGRDGVIPVPMVFRQDDELCGDERGGQHTTER
jgi:hypothetical protein